MAHARVTTPSYERHILKSAGTEATRRTASPSAQHMPGFSARLERAFAAIAFAEAGDSRTAVELLQSRE